MALVEPRKTPRPVKQNRVALARDYQDGSSIEPLFLALLIILDSMLKCSASKNLIALHASYTAQSLARRALH